MESLNIKYRPRTFEDVCGQNITVKLLHKVIETKKFQNVYLFAGSSGCGKTTTARIFANSINKGIGSPIEIDAASNNGVDEVRAIIDSAKQRAIVGEYKIFIIDEAHAITTQGWQAFLKGIEEPPKYTIFIFCTTDPNKIPVTVLNRMQRFNFTPLSLEEVYNRLLYICQQEHFTNFEQTCDLISKLSNGCMREAITYLDTISGFSTNLSLDLAKQIFKNVSYETMFKLTWALQNKNEKDLFTILDELVINGQDLKAFIDTYLTFILDLNKYKIFNTLSVTKIPEYLSSEKNPVVQFTTKDDNFVDFANKLAETLFKIKSAIKYDQTVKETIIVLLLSFMGVS